MIKGEGETQNYHVFLLNNIGLTIITHTQVWLPYEWGGTRKQEDGREPARWRNDRKKKRKKETMINVLKNHKMKLILLYGKWVSERLEKKLTHYAH